MIRGAGSLVTPAPEIPIHQRSSGAMAHRTKVLGPYQASRRFAIFRDYPPKPGSDTVTHQLFRIKGIFVALIALALSASLAFGAQPPPAASFGLENATSNAGKTVPVAGTDPLTTEDEEIDDEPLEEDEEGALEDDESADPGDNCVTDPTTLTEDELAAMKHGSIVCWAAHQETPEGYDNHGAWVSEWAHAGKGSDATAEDAEAVQANGKGKAKGKSKGS